MVKLKKWFKTHLNAFLVALLVPFIALLGAWSTDGVGNLVSDNLINVQDTSLNNPDYLFLDYNLNLSTGTYTLSFDFSGNTGYTQLSFKDNNNNIIYEDVFMISTGFVTHTFSLSVDAYFSLYYINTTGNFSNIMLNVGSSPLPFEPYGIYYNPDNLGNINFNVEDYSVSVGSVPNQISFVYNKNFDISNNYTNYGYLDISTIYTNYIASGVNNTIYVDTPVNNLLTFDMQFNFNTQPNVTIKTFLNLPNGTTMNFVFSVDDFDYKDNWSLSNFVAVSTIANSYDLNDISYYDIMITYNNVGDTLSSIKLGNNNGYNTGYENGYKNGTALVEFWFNSYNTTLNEKYALSTTVESLQNQITQLNEQLNNTIGWKPFIFTMADTPFRVVSNLLGFEVFGVNLYKVLVGLITTLAILWLIRKLRR